jgi:branched-chain amino acid transport system substrate-binding protein
VKSLKPNRRQFLKGTGALATAAAGSAVFSPAVWGAETIKIGFVTPQSGAISVFAEPDKFALDQVMKATGGQLEVDGRKYAIEFIVKDSQSNSSRAAEVANELINKDQVNLLLATATPETTNPAASAAELAEVPCLTNDTPWQPHFFGRGGDPAKGFDWTYHFFWGLEDLIAVSHGIWSLKPTNKVVGSLWPNDADGNAFGDAKLGFPGAGNFTYVDTGRFDLGAESFSSQISAFKAAGAEIVTGVLPPPVFASFWSQAAQQDFRPKIAMMPKALEFPQAVGALGERGEGLTVEVWWSPFHPFSSGLTKQSSKELADEYEKVTGRPWTMPLAFKHSLFEVAINALRNSKNPLDAASVRDALKTTDYNSIVGNINFSKGPVPNIAKTPLVGGQWFKGGKGPELGIVENAGLKECPINRELTLLS